MSLGKIDANEFVTIQKFIPVIFQKYIINDETNMDGLDTSADGLKTVGAFVLRYYYESWKVFWIYLIFRAWVMWKIR